MEVILLSRNSPDTGLRVFNSISHHGLEICRGAFTNGRSPFPYLKALGSQLFLSTNAEDVKDAIEQGCAAATLRPGAVHTVSSEQAQLKIAFDGDAVLFSDELEIINQRDGFPAVAENERRKADIPLTAGPFYEFFHSLSQIQAEYDTNNLMIRTALVTARSAPAHERVIKTFRSWGVRIDEAFFLGGKPKEKILQSFQADIFFDDHISNCQASSDYVATGHVPYGINNQQQDEKTPAD